MRVVSVVVSGHYHLDIAFGYLRFLVEFLTQEVEGQLQIAVEKPTYDAQCKHVSALQHRLIVHACFFQTFFNHRSDGASHHAIGIYA